jgi:hypothetical protein
MTSISRNNRVGRFRPLVLSATAVILVAAAAGYEANWERLRGLPPDQRDRLRKNLSRFDLELTPEQQSAARELDRRLSEMNPEQRAQYLAVLRRYHDWLNSLPENRQDEVTAKPAGERMALVRKLIGEWRVPSGDTPPLLGVVEPGGLSAFELASAYNIWQEVTPKQKATLEGIDQEHGRRERLFGMGSRLKPPIPRETAPEDFDEEKWVRLAQDQVRKDRPILLAEGKAEEPANVAIAQFRANVLKRRGINHYVRQARGVRAVAPDRLARFAASLPGWIQSALDPLPADEATRRLTVAYRLVFPDNEIEAAPHPAGPGTKGPPAQVPRPPTPALPKTKVAPPSENTQPF